MIQLKRLQPSLYLWFALLIFFPSLGVAMSILDAGKVCLFSKISGHITLDGKPAANAVITRKVNLNKDKIDQTTTDDEGYFEMPAVFQRTVTKFLPQEFVASQIIHVNHNKVEYKIWEAVKRTPKENSESRGNPLIVTCELTNEEKLIHIDRAPIFSLCKWDVKPDEREEIKKWFD